MRALLVRSALGLMRYRRFPHLTIKAAEVERAGGLELWTERGLSGD